MDWILQNQFFIILGLLAAGGTAGVWYIRDIQRKMHMLLGDADPRETSIQQDSIRRIARMETIFEELRPRLKTVEDISSISIQKVGFLRFNPFQDMGGDNSFVLALLDRQHNGIVLSSLCMREGTRLYAKRIEQGGPVQPLSNEEKRVLEETIRSS